MYAASVCVYTIYICIQTTYTYAYIHICLYAALGPRVYSASNRNEYLKHKNNVVSGE
jgi:hypothetical protein